MSKKYSVVDYMSKGEVLPLSDYELYYPQFVDSKEILDDLRVNDFNGWVQADIDHPILSEMPNLDRTDYFDIAYGADPKQKLDIHHLNSNQLRPVIIFIHGGGWISLDKDNSRYGGPTWVSLGYTVVSINYRYATQCPHPAQIEDCAMALKWVIDNISQYGGDPNNIAIIGPSSGGHLTALLVTGTKWHQKYNIDMNKVKCWIPISGIHDFNLAENYYFYRMQLFMSTLIDSPEKKDDASPVKNVTGNEPPCLILHGGDDWLVPKTNSIQLYTKLKALGVSVNLEVINNYMHLNMFVNYDAPNDKPAKLVNKFLAQYMPIDKNK